MKKRILVVSIITLLASFFINIPFASARTLKDLRNELAAMEKRKQSSDQNKQLTKEQISSTNKEINDITNKISENETTIKKLQIEIEELTEKAKEKDREIKQIMKFLQVSNGESAYLEYIFGATDLTDFIYRLAVSEQLVDYNNRLIKEYKETVESNAKKKEQLKNEQVSLANKQKDLAVKLAKLGNKLNEMTEVSLSIEEEIASQKKMIQYYAVTLKCEEDENIYACGNVPYSGKMIRPVLNGSVTSEFGYRCMDLNGTWRCSMHNGIDIAGGDNRIYAVAPGVVVAINWKTNCGGTMLFVQHNINGSYYTTGYYHLRSVNVGIGDYVDQNKVIAIMGGDPSREWWDDCSTGQHLHLAVATGLYLSEYSEWSTFTARNINPRTVVNFPAKYAWFSNRTSKY